MKKLALTLIIVLAASFAFAQKMNEKNVPAQVKASFQKQYPKATKTKWSKEGDKYEAEFDSNKEETSVVIDAAGKILETEIEIAIKQLPSAVVEYVKANYKGQSIKEAAKITDANGVITYEAEVKGKDLIFDSSGKFIKESKD